ncbi:hypothetical protein AB1Y20_014921 [Prymnesium parvum]|uniref:Oxidation resistance protein 1 n=1 Tax=Prymnesium parvum TaxID=97485 RepID=A0AB34JZV1_PRYPA
MAKLTNRSSHAPSNAPTRQPNPVSSGFAPGSDRTSTWARAPSPNHAPWASRDTLPHTTRIAAELHIANAARLRGSDSSLLVLGSFAQVGAALGLALLLAAVVVVRWKRRSRMAKEATHKEPRGAWRRLSGRLGTWCGSFYRMILLSFPERFRSHLRRANSPSDPAPLGGQEMAMMGRELRMDAGVESNMKRELSFGDFPSVPKGPPKLFGSSSDPPTVLSQSQLLQLRRALPTRFMLSDWNLLYSTDHHGCSLRTFYSRLERAGATVLVVLDSQGHIFGAFASESWKLDRHYFGNGETFLFRMQPTFEKYGWTRRNSHFILGASDCVAFGGASEFDSTGKSFGLYLDSSFEYGSSNVSATYSNEPLASSTHFKCIKVEVWGFRS